MVSATELTEEGTSNWIEAGGMNIHYHDIGEGPPIIMLHSVGPGGVTAWITFSKILPELSKHFRCIAMDFPNFAKSGPLAYNEPVHNFQARTALALMDALGIEKAHILGNSQGGQTAMVFAAHYPERVDRLVCGTCHIVTGGDTYLMAPYGRGSRRRQRMAKLTGAPATPPAPTAASIKLALADYIDNVDLITDELSEYLYKMGTGRPDLAEARSKSTSTYYDHGVDIFGITAPTLIIWGRYDMICPFEVGIAMLNRIPNARLTVLHCGHWVPFEKPAEYTAHVLNFLTSEWA
jgi:pimeloyl-ACP methyl ester carboxylesterase